MSSGWHLPINVRTFFYIRYKVQLSACDAIADELMLYVATMVRTFHGITTSDAELKSSELSYIQKLKHVSRVSAYAKSYFHVALA